MADLIAELEGVVRLAEKATPGPWEVFVRRGGMLDVAASHNCTVACTAEPVIGDRESNARLIVGLVNFLRTHHAEIAAAVRDAARYRWIREGNSLAVDRFFDETLDLEIDKEMNDAMRAGEGEG